MARRSEFICDLCEKSQKITNIRTDVYKITREHLIVRSDPAYCEEKTLSPRLEVCRDCHDWIQAIIDFRKQMVVAAKNYLFDDGGRDDH
jgi:hypothetical protein